MSLTEQTTEDIRRVSDFIVGWWPGMEDGIHWGSDDNELNPVYQAARRLQAWINGKPMPEFPADLIDRRQVTRRQLYRMDMTQGRRHGDV